jgi:hypothetical protein
LKIGDEERFFALKRVAEEREHRDLFVARDAPHDRERGLDRGGRGRERNSGVDRDDRRADGPGRRRARRGD